MEESKVSVNLTEYKEFIVSQYENGKLKDSLQKEIKRLKNERDKLETEVIREREKLQDNKTLLLELGFKRNSMGSDSRGEQTRIYGDNDIGRYFGYTRKDYDLLLEFGFTKEEILAYINEQWDKREAEIEEAE